MLSLQSDNRILVANAKYTYLTQNYSSGTSTINVANTEPLAVDDFVLLGEFGHGDAEVFRIISLNATTGDIGLGTKAGVSTSTIQAHPESTKVTALPYNEVKFFWTAALGTIADEDPVFSAGTPLSGWVDLDPSSYYTNYVDSTNLTGFGWFEYKNSVTTEVSQESNPIPYVGFSLNTVANVFTDFESLLNVRELKMVSLTDKFAWLNEALAIFKNKLNLSNAEYTVSSPQTINVVAGTNEYQLPDDFCDIVEITTGLNTTTTTGRNIPFMSVSKALSYGGDYNGGWTGGYNMGLGMVYYYIRGRYLGFVPTPTTGATYYYTYRAKSSRLTSLSDYVIVPDNAFYCLKDYMMYRAKLKFSDPSSSVYYQAFADGVSLFIQSAVKRDANLDAFGITSESNA
jgi:hypothetical protein